MKYQIMTDILMMLLSRKKLSAQEIASRHDISARSVYRYVNELSLCGIPVEVTRGRYGGICVAESYRLSSWYFTREEYQATINALRAMASQVASKDVRSALEKLENYQRSDKRENNNFENIIVDSGAHGSNKFSEKLKLCEKAINERKCLFIDYISREGEHSQRVIDPHVLIFKQTVWYLYAFCHSKQSFRSFKISRIKNLSYTGGNFTRKEINRDQIAFDLQESNESFCDLTLQIDKNALPDVEDWLGMENIEPRGNGFVAKVSLPNEGLVNKILSFGGKVKVLIPMELNEKVKQAALKIFEK